MYYDVVKILYNKTSNDINIGMLMTSVAAIVERLCLLLCVKAPKVFKFCAIIFRVEPHGFQEFQPKYSMVCIFDGIHCAY